MSKRKTNQNVILREKKSLFLTVKNVVKINCSLDIDAEESRKNNYNKTEII